MKFSTGELMQLFANVAGATAKSPETANAAATGAGQAQNVQGNELIGMLQSAASGMESKGKAPKVPMFLDPRTVLAIDESIAARLDKSAEEERANRMMALEERKIGQEDARLAQQKEQFETGLEHDKTMFDLSAEQAKELEGIRFENEEQLFTRDLTFRSKESSKDRKFEAEQARLARETQLTAARIARSGASRGDKTGVTNIDGVLFGWVMGEDGKLDIALPDGAQQEEIAKRVMQLKGEQASAEMEPQDRIIFADLSRVLSNPDPLNPAYEDTKKAALQNKDYLASKYPKSGIGEMFETARRTTATPTKDTVLTEFDPITGATKVFTGAVK